MARIQQYLVTVTVSEADERFYAKSGSDSWLGEIGLALDDLADNVADENFDEDGRMNVSFDVSRLPDA